MNNRNDKPYVKRSLSRLLKAEMKSYILLQTAAPYFFLSNLYLKQDIGSVYVIVDSFTKAT